MVFEKVFRVVAKLACSYRWLRWMMAWMEHREDGWRELLSGSGRMLMSLSTFLGTYALKFEK
jgi:hypothetical protein